MGEKGDESLDTETLDRLRKLRRAYQAMLLCVDEQIGRLYTCLKEQGMWAYTLILFTCDHGEMLGDHGFFQKARPQWQSLNVPTAIRHPDHLNTSQITSPVEITDLTATILDAAGLDPVQALSKDWPAFNNLIPCRSLLPLIRGEIDEVRDHAFSECSGRWSTITTATSKYIRYHGDDPDQPNECYYDLEADPDECDNRIHNPDLAERIDWHRRRLFNALERYPACQQRWAPLTGADGSDDFPLE